MLCPPDAMRDIVNREYEIMSLLPNLQFSKICHAAGCIG